MSKAHANLIILLKQSSPLAGVGDGAFEKPQIVGQGDLVLVEGGSPLPGEALLGQIKRRGAPAPSLRFGRVGGHKQETEIAL